MANIAKPARTLSQEEQNTVLEALRLFSEMRAVRTNHEEQWEEIASLIAPQLRGTFTYGNHYTPGEKRTDKQIDSNGMVALHRFGAIVDSLITPRNSKWHGLANLDPYVMKDRATQLWFEDATNTLFKYRYAPISNFSRQNSNVYRSLGAFGNGPMFIDKPDGAPGLRYKAMPMGECYLLEDHQGRINGVVRNFRMTALQHMQKFGETWFPEVLRPALEKNSQQRYDVLHIIREADDYDPMRWDAMGKKYKSVYISIPGQCCLAEREGYNTFPVSVTRYDQMPNDVYSIGPAGLVLPALKTLNAEKRMFLHQGHRAGDPTILLADDGILGSTRPGAKNYGAVNSDGRPLMHILPTGEIQVTIEMMNAEKALVDDAFLVSLFQILRDMPQKTATEVIELINEKGILIAPTVGAQMSEYLGPTIDRELDLLQQQGLLRPMPPRLREAGGEYEAIYTSPLANAMDAGQVSGFLRSVNEAKEIFAITQDPAVMDPFDFEVAMPEVARINGTPASWMASPDKIAAKRQARAQMQQEQMRIQAAPAAAAMMKARAAAQEAGMMPEGEMA